MNIKYIGRHPSYKDTIFGTGLVFERDVTVHPLKPELANRFLRYSDSFEVVPGEETPLEVQPKQVDFSEDDHHMDLLNGMADVSAVASYVFTNFGGYRLQDGMSLADAKQTAKMLYNQFASVEGDFTPKAKPLVVDEATDWRTGPVKPSTIGLEWGPAAPTKQVADLAAKGMSNGDIAKIVGLHHKQVAKILKDLEG